MYRLAWPCWLWSLSTPSPYESVLSSVFSIQCYNTQPLRHREIRALLGDQVDPPAPYVELSFPNVMMEFEKKKLVEEVGMIVNENENDDQLSFLLLCIFESLSLSSFPFNIQHLPVFTIK